MGGGLGGLGAPSSTPTPPPTKHVGWIGRKRRYDPEDLERALKEQRGFGRHLFEEMFAEAAERAVAEKNKAARRVLNLALREAKNAAEIAVDFEPLNSALEAAALATQAKETIAAANLIIQAAERLRLEQEEDDEEAIWLLMN